jgi:hypothetical protein
MNSGREEGKQSFSGFHPLEANFTAVPNQFFDEVIGHYPYRVVAVVGILIRATLGWKDQLTGERRVEAELPLSAFVRTELSLNSARQGIRDAIDAGFIVETSDATNRYGSRYALRWADTTAQSKAITRARKANDEDRLQTTRAEIIVEHPEHEENASPNSRGTNIGDPEFGAPIFVPPYIKESISNKININNKNKALNVSKEGKPKERTPPTPSTPNAKEAGIYAIRDQAVEEIVRLSGDEGSRRRFAQLWEIAEERNGLSAWKKASQALRRRLESSEKQALERPGAYFDAICVKELANREIFVSTAAEKKAEGDVESIILAGLAEAEKTTPPELESIPVAETKAVHSPIVVKSAPQTNEEEQVRIQAEMTALEVRGGALYESFLAFFTAERETFEKEKGTMNPKLRERLVATWEQPQKRRDLYLKWKRSLAV